MSTSEAAAAEYATVSSGPPKRKAGRTKFRETRHPVYKGVRQRGAAGRWVCEVREPNKKSRIWLGTFPTAEMAARAHDVAALALRGRTACLNFADSARVLPVPHSTSPREIQRVAAQAAEAFRPSELAADDDDGGDPQTTADNSGVRSSTTTSFSVESNVGYFDMEEELLGGTPMVNLQPAFYDDEECDTNMSLWSY